MDSFDMFVHADELGPDEDALALMDSDHKDFVGDIYAPKGWLDYDSWQDLARLGGPMALKPWSNLRRKVLAGKASQISTHALRCLRYRNNIIFNSTHSAEMLDLAARTVNACDLELRNRL